MAEEENEEKEAESESGGGSRGELRCMIRGACGGESVPW